MPSILIETRRPYTPEQESELLERVHAAVRVAFKLPEWDRNMRLIAHEPHRFPCPPGRSQPDRYLHVSIDAFEGRSLDAKRDLYRRVVDNLEPFGIPKDHVKILLREIPRENWGIRGGQAACDVELGFSLAV
jgi:phenylpyruvate tautomerase PptA (4-oxalocrotonate tautomerase family)